MNLHLKIIKATALSLINSISFKDIIDSDFYELKYLSYNINSDFLNVNVLNSENTINHYDRITKCIIFDLEKDKNNKKGPYSTFYHELGHHIDWELSLPSSNDNFRKMLIKEGNIFINTVDIDNLIRLISKDSRTSGLSDILSGITLNNYKFKYKHSNKYWLSSNTKVCFEAFAHFYEAFVRSDNFKINIYKNIFPITFDMFIKMIYEKNSAKANIA